MSSDILILSSRDRGDQTIQEIMQTMSFHQREVSLSTKIEESMNYKVILIDQFLNGISSTSFLEKLRTTNKTASMYLLSSRDFTKKEEETINTNKVSVMSLPLIEADLFNRIIA